MRVTLFGASGLLGQDLVRELNREQDQLTALSVEDADLRDHARVRNVVRDSRPDWILLLAAYTDVDGCESNRDLAFAVNCDGAVNVAEAARDGMVSWLGCSETKAHRTPPRPKQPMAASAIILGARPQPGFPDTQRSEERRVG